MKNIGEFWDQRYGSEHYAFGTEPNDWFKQCLDSLTPGYLLLPGEGEGRNAVYAAIKQWRVDAFDASAKGQVKANQLAAHNNVDVCYQVGMIDEICLTPDVYDAIAIIFVHIASVDRKKAHQKLMAALKPGGCLIIEVYSPEQLQFATGGPQDMDMLYTEDILRNDFSDIHFERLETCQREISEGKHHEGMSSVVQGFGFKKV